MSLLLAANCSSADRTPLGLFCMHEAVMLKGGYYDIFRRAELTAELSAIKPHSDVVLDLCRTEHLDCACLGAMIRALNEWNKRAPGTHLRLRNVAPKVERILHLVELDAIFIIETTAP